MEPEKDSKVRLPPSMGAALDALILEAQEDPDLVSKLERGGVITRSAMLRECLSRGMASVRGALRAKTPAVEQVVKPSPKPTKKPATKAKKKARK